MAQNNFQLVCLCRLWNLILKKPGQSFTDSGFLYLDEIAAVSPQDSDKCKGASTDRCEDFQSYSTGHDELVVISVIRIYFFMYDRFLGGVVM